LLRVKYASAFVYCRGGHHSDCARYRLLSAGAEAPGDLLPDGSTGQWSHSSASDSKQRFLVIEDSPVFAALASATIASHYSDSEIVRRLSFTEAQSDLVAGGYTAVVCGYGLGDGRTVHDVRRLTDVPIVVLTGRLEGVEAPARARIVEKSAGPVALVAALKASLS
jgi:hypothetical protein